MNNVGGRYKLVFLGNQYVGKTTLISSIVNGKVANECKPTVGIDFFVKSIEIGNRDVKLHIWDTAGQEKFHSVTTSYARDSFMIILVLSMEDENWLDGIKSWKSTLDQNEKSQVLIVGNKNDLVIDPERVAEMNEEGMKAAKRCNAKYASTSTKVEGGVKPLVNMILEAVEADVRNGGAGGSSAITASMATVKISRKGCC